LSYPDSLNITYTKTPIREYKLEECSTEEKTRFSNNLKDLKKSFVKVGMNSFTNSKFSSSNLDYNEAEETSKISYKFAPKIVNEQLKLKMNEISQNPNTFYWFAAYDKLIKTKHIKKILTYYENDIKSDLVSYIFILKIRKKKVLL
jgi:hypothetical protein